MRNILKRITQAMREIISRINPPGCPRSMMRGVKDTVGGKIPHVWVGVVEDVLFHAEEGFFGFVFPVAHGAEFS